MYIYWQRCSCYFSKKCGAYFWEWPILSWLLKEWGWRKNCVLYMGIIKKLRFELCTLERQVPSCYSSAISRISAQGLRIVCHLLYMQHWKHSPLLGWSSPSLVLLLPLSPCFCSSKCLFSITCKRYSPKAFFSCWGLFFWHNFFYTENSVSEILPGFTSSSA